MSYIVTAADRTSFRRCRRQWDFTAGPRQNLEPVRPPAPGDLDRAVRDALAVYYYPGMWDWDRGVRLPLVVQGLERALARQQEQSGEDADPRWWRDQLGAAQDLLTRYFAWAPTVDQFAPVLIEADYDVQVLDPASPLAGLITAAGEAVRYRGRIDLMAVDQHDAYWIVRHRVVDGPWPPIDQLAQDEETLTACWAWEQFYLGMAISGIIYNEMQRPPHPAGPPASGQAMRARRRWHWPRSRAAAVPPAVRQHEPSGGGRSIPQHRRMYARAREPARLKPIEQRTGDGFRRTWLRRSPADVAGAGRRLGADVAQMIRPDLDLYPDPSDGKCGVCSFRAPCRALDDGRDAAPILLSGYHLRPSGELEEGRLGGGAWSTGRGAAPPRFPGSSTG